MRRYLLLLAAVPFVIGLVPIAASVAAPPPPAVPQVVIAHIDSGINPYHEAFRDRSPRAYQHPSTYIPGYPANVPALRLTLDAPTWQQGFEKDRAIWEGLLKDWTDDPASVNGQMYWIPGTKIIGAMRLGPGGVYCPAVPGVEPAVVAGEANTCPDYPILDDFGHGTMTASRMGGRGSSLCDDCRILSIEGLGTPGVQFAAESGWVDVQTNSWGYVAPDPAIWAIDRGAGANALEEAAATHLVYFASGNGFDGALGFTPWPSQISATLVQGAMWVGGHDNGRVAAWSGEPAHLVADAFGGLAAPRNEVKGLKPTPFACCTSASSPYAASEGAAIVLEARRILGDTGVGVHKGVVARGPRGKVARGPLADGMFTLDELKAVVKHTAEAVPREGRHDGALMWTGGAAAPEVLPYGPGANPYCPGCWTLPVPWTSVPEQFPSYRFIGYGAANERSLDLACRVLAGTAPEPDRAQVDAFFEDDAKVRHVVQHPDNPGG